MATNSLNTLYAAMLQNEQRKQQRFEQQQLQAKEEKRYQQQRDDQAFQQALQQQVAGDSAKDRALERQLKIAEYRGKYASVLGKPRPMYETGSVDEMSELGFEGGQVESQLAAIEFDRKQRAEREKALRDMQYGVINKGAAANENSMYKLREDIAKNLGLVSTGVLPGQEDDAGGGLTSNQRVNFNKDSMHRFMNILNGQANRLVAAGYLGSTSILTQKMAEWNREFDRNYGFKSFGEILDEHAKRGDKDALTLSFLYKDVAVNPGTVVPMKGFGIPDPTGAGTIKNNAVPGVPEASSLDEDE